jgi:hypothetical protein
MNGDLWKHPSTWGGLTTDDCENLATEKTVAVQQFLNESSDRIAAIAPLRVQSHRFSQNS